jgi:hypothetical protein
MMEDNLPLAVRITGLPLSAVMWGWNNAVLHLRPDEREYRMEPYKLFCLISVPGLTLRKSMNERWKLYRDGDGGAPMSIANPMGPPFIMAKIGKDQVTPVGGWAFGGSRVFSVVALPA